MMPAVRTHIAARLFEIADSREPKDWISGYGDDGERYAYPPPLNEPGFFEDFFENRAEDRQDVLECRERALGHRRARG